MAKNEMPEGVKTVIYWAIGLGVIAFIAVVLLILFGNLNGNTGLARLSNSYINETGFLNETGYPVSGQSTTGFVSASVTEVWNFTAGGGGGQTLLPTANYSFASATGILTNATDATYPIVNITYSVSYKSAAELDSDAVINNFTLSQTNISSQFPTVGTILGVALLLVILIGVLIFAIRRLMGAASATGNGRSTSVGDGGFGDSSSFG